VPASARLAATTGGTLLIDFVIPQQHPTLPWGHCLAVDGYEITELYTCRVLEDDGPWHIYREHVVASEYLSPSTVEGGTGGGNVNLLILGQSFFEGCALRHIDQVERWSCDASVVPGTYKSHSPAGEWFTLLNHAIESWTSDQFLTDGLACAAAIWQRDPSGMSSCVPA
jgi:hypothetical protein